MFGKKIVVFEPNQIKSIDNRGTFDINNPNIYHQTGVKEIDSREPFLKERENGPKIADDNETVEVVKIPENSIPDFKTKRELFEFIKSVLGNERNITIKSTGEVVLVSNRAIDRASSKRGNKKYNEAFSSIKRLLENAKYSGFIEADERHKNVLGQDVYHSALMVGDNPYSVQFKVDIPLETGTHNYAGHKITDIKIAPFEDVGGQITIPYKHLKDAISNISLAVLRGKVNPARYNAKNNRLLQESLAGSRVDYDKPSLEYIGRGEGSQVHGWGLYYALSMMLLRGIEEILLKKVVSLFLLAMLSFTKKQGFFKRLAEK